MTLEARALAFGFRDREVGRGIGLALQPGRIVCLLGPNGSGKSTLLRTLLGALAPLDGEVALDGRRLAAWSPRERARRLAYVPQAPESHFEFTLLETVEMARVARAGPFAAPGRADRERARECLARVGLQALADRPIHRVSGGERQLALIARALATEAAYLLMDEPTANLDFGNQALILDEIARLRAAGAGILFSSHQPDHALRIADEVVLLRDGRALAAGAVAECIRGETLSRLYGRPIQVIETVDARGVRHAACVPAFPAPGG